MENPYRWPRRDINASYFGRPVTAEETRRTYIEELKRREQKVQREAKMLKTELKEIKKIIKKEQQLLSRGGR